MKVLLLGAGGRENALAWKIAQSPLLEKLYTFSNNPGIASYAEKITIENDEDHACLLKCVQEKKINFVVVGPEKYLVMGIADVLRKEGISVFGPSQYAAELEGSKSFTKKLCAEFGIPTASFQCFTQEQEARDWVKDSKMPLVIKADGLAAGKGVTIATTIQEAFDALKSCFSGVFGAAGQQVVIEEFLEGEEVSFFCLCDGRQAIPFGSARDYKRVGDKDLGPNTGGMGAFSPSPLVTAEMTERIMNAIIHPTVRAMASRGFPFSGILFAGLMITETGPKLIEYNVRFGDPECQALMMRLEDDLLPLLYASAQGRLPTAPLHWSKGSALCVVLAAKGYPGAVENGSVIHGLDDAGKEDVQIFHAGTVARNGEIFSNGGRVLNIVAKGDTLINAREKAYKAVDKINWPEGFCRSDIGYFSA